MRCEHNGHEWIAADLEVVQGDFLVGVIGYSSITTSLAFDESSWSWLKGTTTVLEGGDQHTLAPFAVDLRKERRWVAFAPTGYVNEKSFAGGFQAVLNEALRRIEEVFSDWEVDVVSSRGALRDWLEENGDDIKTMTITLRVPNPGRDLDDDRASMQSLAAGGLTKKYTARRNQTLRVENEVDALSDELEKTDVDVYLQTRSNVTFNSKTKVERVYVEGFGDDLRRGMQVVVDELKRYSDGAILPKLTGDPDDE
jgi:hypothetical protein